MDAIGDLIADALAKSGDEPALAAIHDRVRELCRRFPLYDALA
jgi:glycine/serine hydroxymethyltransferase